MTTLPEQLRRSLPWNAARNCRRLAHPATHRLHADVEVSSDLGLAQVTPAGESDDVTLERGRELLGHSDMLSAGQGLQNECQLK
jgi:hypothetical protein